MYRYINSNVNTKHWPNTLDSYFLFLTHKATYSTSDIMTLFAAVVLGFTLALAMSHTYRYHEAAPSLKSTQMQRDHTERRVRKDHTPAVNAISGEISINDKVLLISSLIVKNYM